MKTQNWATSFKNGHHLGTDTLLLHVVSLQTTAGGRGRGVPINLLVSSSAIKATLAVGDLENGSLDDRGLPTLPPPPFLGNIKRASAFLKVNFVFKQEREEEEEEVRETHPAF